MTENTDLNDELARQADLMAEIDRLEEMALMAGDPMNAFVIRELIEKKRARLSTAKPPHRPDIR